MSTVIDTRTGVTCPSCDDVDLIETSDQAVCPSCGYVESAQQPIVYSARGIARDRFFGAPTEHQDTCTVCDVEVVDTEHETGFTTCVDTGIHHLGCLSSCTACRLSALEEGRP